MVNLSIKNDLPKSVTLVAVSKGQSIEKIQEAIACGQLHFGESYLQEAIPKIEALKNKNIIWHFIGKIQSNKTKKMAEYFDWVQSVSNLKIAQLLSKCRPINLPPLNICIQTNPGDEILPLVAAIVKLPNLKLRGLMTKPARGTNTFQKVADEFKKLNNLGFNLDTLSMGMSDDFEAAIKAGSTMIRIGTTIFGERNYSG